jgi:transposase
MRFYNQQHAFYCGIDLHKKTMYLCIIDVNGEIVLHKNIRTRRADFMRAVAPFQEGLVVACECMFAWYWIADLCEKHEIDFVLGHALYMRAIYGAKTKNDRQDAYKIAHLLRGGNFPLAYTYPAHWRPTRDLLRRRSHFKRRRAELLTHVQNTITQYNLPPLKKKIAYKANRAGVAEHFPDVHVRRSIEADLVLLDYYDEVLSQLELHLERTAKTHDAHTFYLLKTIPGVGKILGLTLLYEIYSVERFPRVQDFLSYCRLVQPVKTSAGKRSGDASGKKIGNAHLKWAFSEAVAGLLRDSEDVKRLKTRLEKKYGEGRALSILAARLGRSLYHMLRKREAFDMNRFLGQTEMVVA